MNIIIVGCGRVGSHLARLLLENGEEIAIIESQAELLRQVQELDCPKILGKPLDSAILEKAGIMQADALLCVSDSEAMNVMVGQMADRLYHVPRILVRIFYPENELVYQSMGLQTMCSTAMTIQRAMDLLGFQPADDLTTIFGFPVQYELRRVSTSWAQHSVDEVESHFHLHVVGVVAGDRFRLIRRDHVFSVGETVLLLRLRAASEAPEEE